MKHKLFIFLLFSLCLQFCKKAEIDATLLTNSNGLFTFKSISNGDGQVLFSADSTQNIREYFWEFGDGSTQTTVSAKTTHIFKKNATFDVKLTIKNNTNFVSDTKKIIVSNRLARTFDDVPSNERDTIRILYVLTSHDKISGYKDFFNNPKIIENNMYLNKIFIQHIQRTISNYPKEFDKLVFKGFSYILSPADTLQFYNNGDPYAFFQQELLNNPKNPLYQKILNEKQHVAASRIIFLMLNPIISTSFNSTINSIVANRKYNLAGYAPYEGGFVAAFNNTGVVPHELGHSFGLTHDTQRDSRYLPLMNGPETQVISSGNLIWSELKEFQVKGLNHQLVRLKSLSQYGGDFVVPQYWQPILYPNNLLIEKLELRDIATTPYYKSNIDLLTTIRQALIDQYNIKISPNSFKSISENVKFSNLKKEPLAQTIVKCYSK